MGVKIQVEIFSVVTPCRVLVGYQRFRGSRYLHFHPTTTLHAVTCRTTSTWILL